MAEEKIASDIVILDLRPVTDFADFMVICTGVVDVHVRAIADYMDDEFRKMGIQPRISREQNRPVGFSWTTSTWSSTSSNLKPAPTTR